MFFNTLCHNLLGRSRPKVGYETSEPGYESSGYETTGKLLYLWPFFLSPVAAYFAAVFEKPDRRQKVALTGVCARYFMESLSMVTR